MNEKPIWDFLINKIGNEIGAAAVMGNLMAESSLNPGCTTGKNKTKDYIVDADAGRIDFKNDRVAFGLAQWCVWTRKTKLWNYAKSVNKSVGDLQTQLEFLWKELSEDFPVTCGMMKDAVDIKTASSQFMMRYEKPADQSDKMKQRRANYAQKFFDQFCSDSKHDTPDIPGKKMVYATDQVNIRITPDKSQPRLGQLRKGQSAEWIASENGWNKIAVWVSGDYTEVR